MVRRSSDSDTIKRLGGLYFNLEIEEENKMYNWLLTKKLSRYLKNLIEVDMNRSNIGYTTVQDSADPVEEVEETDDLSDMDLDPDIMDIDD